MHQGFQKILLIMMLLAGASPIALADPTTERIKHTPPGEWPSHGRDYSNQRYSPLKQINAGSVSKLAAVWTYKSGVKATFQTTPIVVNGTMYLSLPFNHVVALDARTGKEIWRYEHKRRADRAMCCGPSNRGVAVGYGKVFMGTVDARLIALDEKTGNKVWDIDVAEGSQTLTEKINGISTADPLAKATAVGSTGVGIAMAPVLYEGRVLIGITGVGFGLHLEPSDKSPLAVVGMAGKYGRAGFLAAYDAETGSRLWKFDTVPAKGWEGSYITTTPDGIRLPRDIKKERETVAQNSEAWRYGGGSAWSTPAIDPKSGLLYFGTGNPSPQMEDISRPGDNLYTASLVALEVATGKLRWYYQQVPHDLWGYDVASPAVLFDFERNGKKIPAVAQASKTGWLYIHHRESGELLLKSDAFVPQKNMFQRATATGVRINPGVIGGVNWSPIAIDEERAQAYVAAVHWPVVYTLHATPASGNNPALRYTAMEPVNDERWGVLAAIDLKTGHLKWEHKFREPLIGGVLATAGNLVFTGEGNGNFNALDASNGALLWQYRCEAGANAPPITYEIDGVQYLAIAAGGNQLFGFNQGDQVAVFALSQ
ncbi:MAG: PQQ-binding-like beta-propeller repeat protein [Rugosibacter sp.]|nr:PQQ-binding-like beta-propeller repeat protein [Rugosibacter sp.]